MPALNFQKQFVLDIENGKKQQTIRAYRKDGRDSKPGDRLYLYAGMRTKACRKLGEATCVKTAPVEIGVGKFRDTIILDGKELDGSGRAKFSRADGFACTTELLRWFEQVHGLPFEGVCIQWDSLPKLVKKRGGEDT